MSEATDSAHNNDAYSSNNSEHGSISSYVVGFLLSLVFTFIPYYMVVNKSASSSALMVIILVVAVLQMLVQIFFFLHLGRGPKPLYNVVFFVFTVVTILIVVGGSIYIMDNLQYKMEPAELSKNLAEKEGISQIGGKETGACQSYGTKYKVIIINDKASPSLTTAQLCDTLTFINEDDTVRKIYFGSHAQHGSYAGETEILVRKGRGKTIVLNQLGSYLFHDDIDTTVTGAFTIEPKNDKPN